MTRRPVPGAPRAATLSQVPRATQQRHRALVVALLATLLLWNLPFGGFILYPFKLLATWLHETSHGIVMLVTRAGFHYMDIYRDTSGLAYANSAVGSAGTAAIAAAGYMGTPLFGALLVVLGQRQGAARGLLVGLAAALSLSALLFVRNDFGLTVVLVGAAACLGAALAGRVVAVFLLNFIAAQACINALLDIRVLFRSTLVVNGEVMGASDAHNMAAASFGSAWMWAALWLAWAFVVFYVALRVVYLQQQARAARTVSEHGSAAAQISGG